MAKEEMANVKIALSPLSKEIMVFRHGKRPNVALERRPVTGEVMGVVVDYIQTFEKDKNGKTTTLDFSIGDRKYELRLKALN